MIRYLLYRIALFIPTLLVISLLAFGLSKVAPGDPVLIIMRNNPDSDLNYSEKIYNQIATRLGLNKPTFYFGIKPLAYPDTIYQITKRKHRENLQLLIAQYGNWEQIEAYYKNLLHLEKQIALLPDTISRRDRNRLKKYEDLYSSNNTNKIQTILDSLESTSSRNNTLKERIGSYVARLNHSYSAILTNASPYKLYIPSLQWYGFDNQYHNWISNFIVGDFGESYIDGQPVAKKMKTAVFWTLLMNSMAIIIAYLLSIPIGVRSAVQRGSIFDRGMSLLLFMLYSLPTFWIATLLILFFTNSEYGMDWFPTHGLGDQSPNRPFGEWFWNLMYHLILPVFCLTYGSLAFISRQMRGGMIDVLRQDYIRTARAKGLNQGKVVWKHAFRNSLFPIITLFASVFPAAIAGSVVIESIFGIPGMGRETIMAINSSDWPVVYTVLMLAAILTMLGILIADILYAVVDPRVKFNKN